MKINFFLPILAVITIVTTTGCQKAQLKPSNQRAAIARFDSSFITLPLDIDSYVNSPWQTRE